MSEIKNKVREEIARTIYFDGEIYEEGSVADVSWKEKSLKSKEQYLIRADQILSIPELAIVDRDAELPECPLHIGKLTNYTQCHYEWAEHDMVEAGYVKEVK